MGQVLPISKDEDLELHLKKQPGSWFVNNYLDVGLKAWQAEMYVQTVFNDYKAVTYMCHYFSKTEDQCSQAIKQAAKEALRTTCIMKMPLRTPWKQLLKLT